MRDIVLKLKHYSQYPLDTCGVLYRIGSVTEDRQGGARPPRASNFKL